MTQRTRISNPLLILLLTGFLLCLGLVNFSPNTGLADDGINATEETHYVFLPSVQTVSDPSWPTLAANPQRTSWTEEEVNLRNAQVLWYRPLEAYIPQNVQIIAEYGKLYIATAGGLYALNAGDGSVAWRFDTEMPLGHSPTVANGVVYVGGYDRRLYALDAQSGALLWSFNGAKAGYNTNPLVVEGKVIVGSRDGRLYAIAAHNQPNQGQLLWQFQAGSPIHFTPAYNDGIIYFAATDLHAYAVRAADGDLVWRSETLPGEQYQSYWPVIYRDKVIFAAAQPYRTGVTPGTNSVTDANGTPFGHYRQMQLYDVFAGAGEGTPLGPRVADQPWAHGYPIVDVSRVTEYLENNPNPADHAHKPWRRVVAVLNLQDGREYTFDSDNDGYPEYMPITWWGTNSGNLYPPIVGPDGIVYMSTLYECCSDAKGRVMGWQLGTKYMSVTGGFGAVAEPQAISMGGGTVYRNLCCDRVGDWFSILTPGQTGTLWSYNLDQRAPNYDPTWMILPGWPRLQGWYYGEEETSNAAYHNHGVQNAIIPYQGKLFVHRSNTIIAFGSGTGPGRLPLLPLEAPDVRGTAVSTADLTASLEAEISKMIAAGPLRPGYYNPGQMSANLKEFASYFENPGETLYTLSIAYPHLSPQMQNQLRPYLQQEFAQFFDANAYATRGWNSGAGRENIILPPEVQADLQNHPPRLSAARFSWSYPPFNYYALWKYAEVVPADTSRAYAIAKSRLSLAESTGMTNDRLSQNPYEHNAFIAGYIGFLELQELAGATGTDAQLRTQVTNELNRLMQLRVSLFDKDSYWGTDRYHKKHLDVARNFIWLVPELGDYLQQQIPQEVQAALAEYELVAPYWFVARFESTLGEGAMSPLWYSPALFQARAYVLHQPQTELSKYLDAPAFLRGDLFYIQNLVAALEAP